MEYFRAAVDLGDTPRGAGDDWVNKKLEVGRGKEYRGDGTREKLEQIAKETHLFMVVGLVEKAGGSLYCAVVYVCPRQGCLGKRRKVMPTGSERLVWAQGSTSTLRAVTTEIAGVRLTLAAAICWENMMPLLRFSLYSQNVNIYFAPTADARDTWLPLMRTIACEGRMFVLSSNQCMKRKHLPEWIIGEQEKYRSSSQSNGFGKALATQGSRRRSSVVTKTEDNHEITWPATNANANSYTGDHEEEAISSSQPPKDHNASDPNIPAPVSSTPSKIAQPDPEPKPLHVVEHGEDFVSRGGSCIISPFGTVLAGPLWEVEDGGLLTADIDLEDCERGRLDLDVAGSYGRNDSFELKVSGLDINPPP